MPLSFSATGRRLAVRRRGRPLPYAIAYAFPGSGTLEVRRDHALELTEERINAGGLDARTALSLLRAGERFAFGREGCGISWGAPGIETTVGDTREVVYRGEVCTCQGRILYRHDEVSALTFRSAC
jgi:hypothetical protein